MRRIPSGFTLIELVVVITILGILTALALPRFAALQTEARMAKMQAAMGSLKAGAVLAHSVQLTQQLAANASVTMEGAIVPMANGYPTSALDSIGVAAGFVDNDGSTVLQGYVASATATTFTVTPDAGHPSCSVTYTVTTTAGQAPAISNAGVTTANCQ